jgi:hypothetical protein
VPGVTGTEMVDAETGALLWGSGWRLLTPRDRGRSIALPLDGGPPRAVPGRVLDEIGFPGYRKPIYGTVAAAFAAAGWTVGALEAPRPQDTFLTFAFDWRQDLVASAAALRGGLERLQEARGGGPLAVDLVCQSSGASVCRYLVKHGGAPLEAAEAGVAALPPGIAVRRVVLVGASNAGSVRIFSMLHRGRRYIAGGRLFGAETLFTFPSLFQDLPAGDGRIFVDGDGRPLAADVWVAADWERHGWSVFAPSLAARLEREGDPLFLDAAGRSAYLRSQLDRARRFRAVLERDVEIGSTRYHLVQEAGQATMRGAVLEPAGDGWRVSFPGDDRVADRPALVRRLSAPGDGHATLASQNALSPRERAALGAAPLVARGGHFEMLNAPETLRWLIAVLGRADDTTAPARPTGSPAP